MYYRQRRRASLPIIPLIIIGVLAGVAFLVYDNMQRSGNASREAAPTPTVQAVQPTDTAAASTTDSTDSTDSGSLVSDTGSQVEDFAPDIPVDTMLFIPKAGIDAHIVRVYLADGSWDVSRLGQNVGHLQGTAWIGQPGNVVLSGHVELADGRMGVFSNLDELVVGDLIFIKNEGAEYQYQITEINSTTPDDLAPLYPSTTRQLTLITCAGYDFWQDTYVNRTVIVAQQVG